MRYAVVRNNTVDNIIECNGLTVQGLAKVMNCMLIACENYAVAEGDTYDNGVFYRDGEPLERIPSTDEKVAQIQAENVVLKEVIGQSFQAQVIADRAAETNYISDDTILKTTDIVSYAEYQDAHQYDFVGEIIKYNGRYYEVIAKHLSNAVSYPVETTFAYYRLIELTHTGTIDDPIPYPETAGILVNVGEGKYYSYKGKIYLAKADMPNCVYPPDTPSMWQWELVEV